MQVTAQGIHVKIQTQALIAAKHGKVREGRKTEGVRSNRKAGQVWFSKTFTRIATALVWITDCQGEGGFRKDQFGGYCKNLDQDGGGLVAVKT